MVGGLLAGFLPVGGNEQCSLCSVGLRVALCLTFYFCHCDMLLFLLLVILLTLMKAMFKILNYLFSRRRYYLCIQYAFVSFSYDIFSPSRK